MSWQSTYCSMDNNPIKYNDPKGDTIIIRNQWKDDKGNIDEKKVLYKKGKLYDLNGKLYIPEKGGYFEKVQNDLNLLKSDGERSKNVVNQLDNSKNTHIISNHVYERPKDENIGNYNLNFKDNNTITKYDAFSNFNIAQEKRNPRVGLIHELTHAWDYDKDFKWKFEESNKVGGVKLSEIHAVNVENTIRKVTGDPKRIRYSGVLIPNSYLNK